MRLLLPLGVTALAFGLCGSLLSGCSVLIDVDGKQCSTDDDCAKLGQAFASSVCEQNVCVVKAGSAGTSGNGGSGGSGGGAGTDELECEKTTPATTPTVNYKFAPIFADGSEPDVPKPFSISVCKPADLECAKPIFGPVDVPAGMPADFPVPPGFQGYFSIKNPDTLDALLFMGQPITQDTVGWNITVPTAGLVQGFGFVTGEKIDPELGLIISVARDCSRGPLEGVSFTNSKGGLQFYFVMSTPDTSLTETGPQGAVGFANVPISTTTLKGTFLENNHELTEAIIRVKPHTVSLVELFP